MPLLELEDTISGKGVRGTTFFLQTAARESAPWGLVDRDKRECERQAKAEAWNKLNSKLIDWNRDPSRLEDDGIEPPSPAVISRAYEVARHLQDRGRRAFDRVVPTADGGIAFSEETGNELTTLEIDSDGTIELFHFRGSDLAFRARVALPANPDG